MKQYRTLTLSAIVMAAWLTGVLSSAPVDAQQSNLPLETITGRVEVVQEEDFETGKGRITQVITDQRTGRSYWLNTDAMGDGASLTTGTVVKARGRFKNHEFVLAANDEGSTLEVLSAPATAPGVRTVAVLVVNFQDAQVTCSNAAIAQTMFGDSASGGQSVSDYYMEASYDQVLFDGDADGNGSADVFGPFTINVYSDSACDYYAWSAEAENAAAASGVNLSLYQHIVFVLPTSNTCGGWGWGNLGCGSVCRTWIARCDHADIFAHELGHNLGMHHASKDADNDGTAESEYGDYSDVMGYSGVGLRHPSAPHKEQMGWFAGDADGVQEISQSGTYYIASLHADPWSTSLPQMLKIYKADSNEYYYLSYRLPEGYDSSLRNGYFDRLTVHRYLGSGSAKTNFIKALVDGDRFDDSANGFSVTQLSHSIDPLNGYVEVQVEFGCVTSDPNLSASPPSQASNSASTTKAYSVTLTNMDMSSCGDATFTLSASAASNWAVELSDQSVTVVPGGSLTTTLSVTPSSDALDGAYAITVTAADTSGERNDVSAVLEYVLDSHAPDAVTDLAGSANRKGVVDLTWSATSDGSGTGVAGYEVYRNDGPGFVLIGSTASTSFKDSGASSGGTFEYCVIAVDALGNASEESNVVSLSVSGSTKGGGKGGGGGGGDGSTKPGGGGGNGKGKNK